MSKITKNEFGKKLAKYGALSLAIAGVADATGQVIYTDLDPDFSGTVGDMLDIDFNGDAVNDVQIRITSSPGYDLAQVAAGSNGVIAASNGGFFYASNLSYGAAIDGAAAFNSFGDLCASGGFAGSQFCGAAGYVGIQFAVGTDTHYGWVQLDVASSGALTVMDYAYEATPDTAIAAGDEGEPLGVADQAFNNFNFFMDKSGNLNLSAATAMESVTIHNIAGQQVIARNLSSSNEVVNMSALTTGVYLATVSIDGSQKTFKVAKR